MALTEIMLVHVISDGIQVERRNDVRLTWAGSLVGEGDR